ncbi:MAG: DsbA family protein [Chloroflexi bacterium]|nr:DsbA family protein [Chloroflexota bacterium]
MRRILLPSRPTLRIALASLWAALLALTLAACGGQAASQAELETAVREAVYTAVAEAVATNMPAAAPTQSAQKPPSRPAATATPAAQKDADAEGPQRVEVSADDDPSWGPEDAPITIIEFSDFQCPFCARFRKQTYDRLKEEYGDKIRFVYRDFPLVQIHPEAVPAALAANCAGEQGKYWEYHDLLFLGDRPLNRDTYIAYAEQLGLDVDEFSRCLDEERYLDEIQKDFDDGVAAGVRGTPTFFVNGIPLVGAQPFENFKAIIDQELERLGQK